MGEVLRELLFPFEAENDSSLLCRIEPSTIDIESILKAHKGLNVFP